MVTWDPDLYVRFADHRDRPFHDLLARVSAAPEEVARAADLGCGPGTLTATLRDRWPSARVLGVDSSAEMIDKASQGPTEDPLLRFVQQDLRDWIRQEPLSGYDLIVSNATLQWVPDHLDLLPDLVCLLRPAGWLAIQIPGNHDAPLHTILRELARSGRYAAHAAPAADRFTLPGPTDYLRVLAGLGCQVDAWETTYYQVLHGPDPVYRWISGTGARPVLQALPEDPREQFVAEYQERLRQAYPAQDVGTVLPFRRVFAVARRAPGANMTS